MSIARRIPRTDLEDVLKGTAPLWEQMRGQNIFLTGGTGFFGCWLLESFCYINEQLSLEAKATVLTRSPAAFTEKAPHLAHHPAVRLLAGDVRTFAYPEGEYPFVIHAATEASARQAEEDPLAMLGTIVGGTERTLAFAASHGTRRLLLTSSGAVYGRQPGEMTHLPETYAGAPDPLDARSVYAEGKRTAELLCALYAKMHGLECAIARCWAFCGPHLPLDTHFAIGNFIGDVLAGRPIRIAGDGAPRRSYLYGSDLAVWLWTMLFRAPSLVPIHVGSASDVSILELAETVGQVLGKRAAVEVAGTPVAGALPARYVPAVARAYELLGLKQTVTLEQTIARTAEWYSAPSEVL